MKNNEKKDKIQREALRAWIKSKKVGTCEIITGLGKTFIALHALYTMPKNDGKIHLFLAEVKDRKKDLYLEIKKYNEIFNRDVLKDYNLKFKCYQAAYKYTNLELGLVISDEVHDASTPSYSKFFTNNKYDAIIGLSATIDRKTSYEIKPGKFITKGNILDSIAPVIFKYNFKKAFEDETTRKLNIHIILGNLNSKDKTIKAGPKKKPFYQTEDSYYKYWTRRIGQSFFIADTEKKELMFNIATKKRNDLLYSLPSKINEAILLTESLKGKTILFGNHIKSLLQITPNTISSYNKDVDNDRIRKNFDNDKINLIASFKKLKQGANLKGLDNCVIISYYGSSKDLTQRIGRLRNNGEIGKIFIFVTRETQEETWFSKMFENFENVKTFSYNSVREYLNK